MSKLEELKAAYEAATKGEWETQDSATVDEVFAIMGDNDRTQVGVVQAWANGEGKANAQFIALARNLMPILLEAVDVLKRAHEYAVEFDDPHTAAMILSDKDVGSLLEKLQ